MSKDTGPMGKLIDYIASNGKGEVPSLEELTAITNAITMTGRIFKVVSKVLTDNQLDFVPMEGPTIRNYLRPAVEAFNKADPYLKLEM